MHRVIRDHLEQVLADSHAAPSAATSAHPGIGNDAPASRDYQLHLEQCDACRGEIEAMRRHAVALRQLRSDAEPRPGFYGRVMERIESHLEAQRARSIWSVFSESPFGRNLAVASMALAVLLGVFLLTSEQFTDQGNQPVQIISATLPGEDQPASNVRFVPGSNTVPDRDAVLVNLVTYRGQ
jgi:hypothetical protein